jgi:hypothetical protein
MEEIAEALRLRRAGHSFAAIANKLDMSEATAARRVHAGLKAMVAEQSELLRAQIEDRLDATLLRFNEIADDEMTGAEQRIKALSGVLAVEKQRAVLLGLNLPARVIVGVERGEIPPPEVYAGVHAGIGGLYSGGYAGAGDEDEEDDGAG